MTEDFRQVVYLTGIADCIRGKKYCPVYWRKKEEEAVWKQGFNYMTAQFRR